MFEMGLSISGALFSIEHMIRITDLVPVLGDEGNSTSETGEMHTGKVRTEHSLATLNRWCAKRIVIPAIVSMTGVLTAWGNSAADGLAENDFEASKVDAG
jgi:hypothetical protein